MSKGGLIDDYFKANQKAKENMLKKAEAKFKLQMSILKDGNWNSHEKERISTTLELANETFPNNLEQQANFIQFQLETYLDVRIQLLIYNYKAQEGHCLHAINGKYIEIQC